MSSQPAYPSPRPNLTGIAAACILSGGLIAAAIIDSHKPPTGAGVIVATASGRRMPPISKESLRAQITSQLLAAPQLRGVKPVHREDGIPASSYWFSVPETEKNRLWSLTGVAVTDIAYRAKDDEFDLTLDLTWQDDQGTVAHIDDLTTLSNDGYDQYHKKYTMTCVKNASSGDAPTVILNLR